jgi:hypothetical protein
MINVRNKTFLIFLTTKLFKNIGYFTNEILQPTFTFICLKLVKFQLIFKKTFFINSDLNCEQIF